MELQMLQPIVEVDIQQLKDQDLPLVQHHRLHWMREIVEEESESDLLYH